MICKSCDKYKTYLTAGKSHNCKKTGKICEKVDFRLAQLAYEQYGAPSTFEDLYHTSQKILEGHGRIKRQIESNQFPYPHSEQAFVTLLCQFHAGTFQNSGLSFAGALRKEDVKFGSGKNEIEGSPPENIDADLRKLYKSLVPSLHQLKGLNQEKFIRLCGLLLEEFFLVHPFLDGNGRVGRFLLIFLTINHGRFRFRAFSENKKDIEDYRVALEFAHRHSKQRVIGEIKGRVQDPLMLLVPWLNKHLNVITENDVTEIAPDEICDNGPN